ncbi:MAG TPA: PAS domain S-box protein [Anaerolineae bacterium]
MINTVPIGVIAVNSELMITSINSAVERICTLKAKDFLGLPLQDLLDLFFEESFVQELCNKLGDIVVSEEGFSSEACFRTETEDDKYLRLMALPSFFGQDESKGLLLTFEDITKRKRMEEGWQKVEEENKNLLHELNARVKDLQESEERYRRLIELSPEIILVYSEDSILYINQAGAKYLGVERPEDVIGKPILDFIHHSHQAEIKAQLQEVSQLGMTRRHVEQKVILPDEQIRYLEVSSVPVFYSGQAARQAIIIDVTERKQAETALEESRRRLQALFDNALEAILLADDDAHYVDVNPAACSLLGYSREELLGMRIWDITPERNRDGALAGWRAFLAAGKQSGVFTVETKDGTLREVEFRAVANILPGLHLSAKRDVTERKRVEEEVRRHMAHTEALAEISQALAAATLDTQTVLDTIAHHAADTIGDACVITLLSGDGAWLSPVAFHHPDPDANRFMGEVLSESRYQVGEGPASAVAQTGHPLLIPVVSHVQLLASLKPEYRLYLDHTDVHSVLIVPLRAHGRISGTLGVTRDAPGKSYTVDDQAFLLNVADRAALAIVNAQLFDQVQRHASGLEQRVAERTAELVTANKLLEQEIRVRQRAEASEREQRTLAEALADITAALNSTLDLDEVLERILANVEHVVSHDMASIMLVESGIARVVRTRGHAEYSEVEDIALAQRFAVTDVANLRHMTESGQPFAIPDTRSYPGWVQIPGFERLCSYAGAPIQWHSQIIGFLELDSATPGFFTQAHAERLGVFADHAAIAIRNAQLYRQAQELATLQERQRLARELHDAVSQTLWSTTLIADVLPALWEQDPIKGREKLKRLNQLTRSALAEMRTLLLELRPASLLEVNIAELLRQLVATLVGHTKAEIHLTIEGDCRLPSDVQVAFYRIAQEALNNAAHHAMARQIEVHLRCWSDHVELSVKDDGRGFEPVINSAGRMGLSIMRERAERVGALLSLSSQVGKGTKVLVIWPDSPEGSRRERTEPNSRIGSR